MLYSPPRNHKGMHLFSPRRTASTVLPAATSAISATASAAASKLGMGTDDAQKPEDSGSPNEEQETPEFDEMTSRVDSTQDSSENRGVNETERAEESTPSNDHQGTKPDEEMSEPGTEILITDRTGKEDDGAQEKVPDDQSEWAPNLFYAYARRVSL
jgi:hypothetical protein